MPVTVIVAAAIGAFATIISVIITGWYAKRGLTRQNEKIQEIHVLVNKRLDMAIKELEAYRAKEKT